MRLGSRRSAPPAATSERLTSGMPSFAPREATIRSQASAISKPPATAKPSIAAMIGLRGGPCTMPANPRCSANELSPATKAFRSMPAENPLPAPVRMPTCRSSSSSRRSSAAATPVAIAALTALRWSGRLSVISRTPPSASVSTASSAMRSRSLREQRQRGLTLAAQHGEVDLDPADPARVGQHARLRLDHLRRQHPAAAAEGRVEPDPLQVARELLDRVDRPDPLDLDRNPAVAVVAAHQVDGPDVRRPLAPDEPEALAAPPGRRGERLLEVRLDPVLLEPGIVLHVVHRIGDDVGEPDLEPVVALELAHDEQAGLLLDHRRRRHPVQRLDLMATAVGPHHERAVALDHQQPQRLREPRRQ